MLNRCCLILLLLCCSALAAQTVSVIGAEGVRRWHKVTVTIAGPKASETGQPNPFLDYRLRITFTHRKTRTTYVVPGYFAADGRAAESSASSGDKWRAHLSPDLPGVWDYLVSFRAGSKVALATTTAPGVAVKGLDGLSGSFTVLETNKSGRDHRAAHRGRLRYVGKHHLQFAGGSWFLKAGSDSPENLLAYADIDNTPNTGNRRKTWAPHVKDWRSGDPTWKTGKGKGLIGAINYMADQRMNAMSFLTYNYNGDDKNVFPYVDPKNRLRFDCSKLDQWEILFQHMDRRGLYLHFKTQEQENDQDLDGGKLGDERRLYYRELIARFAHHLALNWNLGEENTNSDGQRKAFAQFFYDHDPYRHLVVVHTFPGGKNAIYTPLLGKASRLTGASLQSNPLTVFQDTKTWVQKSSAAGRPWVVANDEQGSANAGIKPDKDDVAHDTVRVGVLWGNLMAGGAGIESYFGYAFAHSDLTCQDFRSRDVWWDQCRHGLEFFAHNRVPFWNMQNQDGLVSSGWCLAGQGQFVVYRWKSGAVTLDLTGQQGVFEIAWFDPRRGGGLQVGTVATVSGGGKRSLGLAPNTRDKDWAILVRPTSGPRLEAYGIGCPGTDRRVPTLLATGLPRLGASGFGLRVDEARSKSAVLLYVGATRGAVVLPGGCRFWLQNVLFSTAGSSDAAGSLKFAFPIPNAATLAGVNLFATAAIADPNGAFMSIANATNGLRAVIQR